MNLKSFLQKYPHPGLGVTAKSIWESRSRAKRESLPDPYPWLKAVRGLRGLQVQPTQFNAWASGAGRPQFDFGDAAGATSKLQVNPGAAYPCTEEPEGSTKDE